MATLLPDDLIFLEILTRLPAKSLMRFKCVSKIWKTLISGDPHFINAHRKQHNSEDNPLAILTYSEDVDDEEDEDVEDVESIVEPTPGPQIAKLLSEQCSKALEVDMSYFVKEYGTVGFTSSCEGLICVKADELPERVVLWNPATQQRRQLPCPSDDSELRCVAIGMDDRSGDWKVVRLCLDVLNIDFPYEFSVRAHVFVKSSTAWRDCGASGIRRYVRRTNPVAAAGALHWLCIDGQEILSFDLDTEVLRLSNGPDCKYFTICKWRSSVAAFTYDDTDNSPDGYNKSCYLMVSSASSDDGRLIWSKLLMFTPGLSEIYRSIWREQILVVYSYPYCMMALIDPKAPEEVRKLEQFRINIHGGCGDFRDYVLTIESVF